MVKKCAYCDRELVDEIPDIVWTALCGGLGCGHHVVYGLNDCRQVVLKS